MTEEKKVQTNPARAIHELCVSCMGDHRNLVKECNSEICPLHPWRLGNPYYGKPKPKGEITNPVKVIRHFCHHHCQPEEWDDACDPACPAYPFRNGRNPFRAEKTPAQMEVSQRNGEKLQLCRRINENSGFSAQD